MKRFLLWDYPRASWQYDVIVLLILAFIFLTPRDIFRDQPRASNIVRLPGEYGGSHFWVEPELLEPIPENERAGRVSSLLKAHYGKPETVIRIDPIFDNEHELKGYMAVTKP